MENETTAIRMHIVDLESHVESATSLDALLQETSELWPTIYDEMTDQETLWVFAPNKYIDGKCWPVAMTIANHARDGTGLVLKNTITRYKDPTSGGDLQNMYEEILFLVRNKREYRFRKDPIRIEHVYEGNEWGDRETGTSAYHDTEVQRYNPDGKDPGNVWLQEIRDETDDETVDDTHPLPRTEAIRRCVKAGSDPDETVCLWNITNTEITDLIKSESREVEHRSIKSTIEV